MVEKQMNLTQDELEERQELSYIQYLIDAYHGFQLDKKIEEELDHKKLNDKIIKFAQKEERTTVTKNKYGDVIGTVEAQSRKGIQSFKYQEIIRRQEAIAEKKRIKEEKEQSAIREKEFWQMQQLLEQRKKDKADALANEQRLLANQR